MPIKDMLDDLKRSGISKANATKAGMKFLTGTQTAKALSYTDKDGNKKPITCESYTITYHDLNGKPTKYIRYRMMPEAKEFFTTKKVLGKERKTKVKNDWIPRYFQKQGSAPQAYYSPITTKFTWKKILKDTTKQIIFTEGEKKALVACGLGHPTISLGGVYGYRSAARGMKLLPSLEKFDWENREVVIMYDSDVKTNNNVQSAMLSLAGELLDRGALIEFCYIPEGANGEKQGIDDFVIAGGSLKELLESNDVQGFARGNALNQMGKEFAFLKKGSKFLELDTGYEMSRNDFVGAACADKSFVEPDHEGNNKTFYTAKEYNQWPNRTVVDRRVYEPQVIKYDTETGEPLPFEQVVNQEFCGKSLPCYNMWREWGVQHPKKGDIKPWKDLLHFIFNGDTEEGKRFIKHVTQWIAYPIQNAGEKNLHALIVWSPFQGNGKTLFTTIVSKLYGENAGQVTESQLKSDFNKWVSNKQFIVGEETTERNQNDKRKMADQFKTFITGETIDINDKNTQQYSITNCLNFIFTSNRGDVFYIEPNDRRYAIWEVKKRKAERAFYKTIDNWYKSEEGLAALMYYMLYEVDLANYDNEDEPLMTQDKKNMMGMGNTDLDEFVQYDVVEADHILVGQDVYKRDLLTLDEIQLAYEMQDNKKPAGHALKNSLIKYGAKTLGKQTRTIHGIMRLWAVRNVDYWLSASPAEVKQYFEDNYKDTLADVVELDTTKKSKSKKFANPKPNSKKKK